MSSGTILCARHQGTLILKLTGIIRYASLRDTSRSTASFQAFLKCCFQRRDFDHVLIDLTETESIDSTNLGLLAQVAQFTLAEWNCRPTILSTRDDINVILESVGFEEVFQILHEVPPLGEAPLDRLPDTPACDSPVCIVLDAHRALMAISDKNKVAYKDVVEVLEEQAGAPASLTSDLPPAPRNRA
jgi:anti-anti-sigma regulatory factor